MRVSVVISSYNYARFLPACLDSVLAQTYPNLEIIVVDDGSTDDSAAVLASYEPRIRTIFQQNGGQASAMNRGAAAATGDVVCLLDCDDAWATHKVQRMVDVFSANPDVGWIRHKAQMVDEHMRRLETVAPTFSGSAKVPADPAVFTERTINAQPSMLAIKRPVVDKVFPLIIPAELQYDADDAVLLARIFATGTPGYSLDEVLGFYRRHMGARFGAHDLPKLLRREADVTEALPLVFGRSVVPSAAYKLRAVLAAMDGARPWDPRRAGAYAKGMVAVTRLWSNPKLMLRQAVALSFAYAAPNRWLRRLARSQNWPESR